MSTHHVNFCCDMDHTNVVEIFKIVIMSSNDNLKTLLAIPGKLIQNYSKILVFRNLT